MAIELPPLPFEPSALEPYISRQTIEFHYGKHHRGYVNTLNQLIKGTSFETKSLMEILLASKDDKPKVFNNAAQAWNHTFFWNCISGQGEEPSRDLARLLTRDFGSFEDFKNEFNTQCKNLFGSGWTWLVRDRRGELKIKPMSNAGNPMTEGEVPLLACDVWEHAYYLDYQNERMKYVENFWNIVNWQFIETSLEWELEKSTRRPAPARHERSAHL